LSPDLPSSEINNFGLLRIIFALLVIVSHASELKYGNRSHEVLDRVIGVSFGEIAVLCFFLVSGYLVIKSYMNSPSIVVYLRRRVRRIYPAFIACFLLCLFPIAYFAGGHLNYLFSVGLFKEFFKILILQTPFIPGTFEGLPYPVLNGAIWTIAYEFRCYPLVIVMGYLGLFRPAIYVVIAAVSVVVATIELPHSMAFGEYVFGLPFATARFTAAFLVGGAFYILRDHFIYDTRLAMLAAALMMISVVLKTPVITAFIVFGSYLVFLAAFAFPLKRIASLTGTTDISYGVYLDPKYCLL
jgi:peptidoglycan/LPS O-acetylase OafA/YrhL